MVAYSFGMLVISIQSVKSKMRHIAYAAQGTFVTTVEHCSEKLEFNVIITPKSE